MKKDGAKYKVSPRGKRKLDFPQKLKKTSIKLPLIGKTIFLDVKELKHQKRLQADLKKLGATIEVFVSKDIDYLITAQPRPRIKKDRDGSPAPSPFNCDPSPSPGTAEELKVPTVTRGKALAERARIKSTETNTLLDNAEKWGVKIVPLDTAYKWIEKELRKLPKFVQSSDKISQKPRCIAKYKLLEAPFLKFESSSLYYRPVNQHLDAWPHLNVDTPRGSCPFDGTLLRGDDRSKEERGEILAAQVDIPSEDTPQEEKDHIDSNTTKQVTEKSTKKSETEGYGSCKFLTAGELRRKKEQKRRQERKRGYCECCKVKYEDLDKHVREENHRQYVKDKSNYQHLDSLIGSVQSTAEFLKQYILASVRQTNQPAQLKEQIKATKANKSPMKEKQLKLSPGVMLSRLNGSARKQNSATSSHIVHRIKEKNRSQKSPVKSPCKVLHQLSEGESGSEMKENKVTEQRQSPRKLSQSADGIDTSRLKSPRKSVSSPEKFSLKKSFSNTRPSPRKCILDNSDRTTKSNRKDRLKVTNIEEPSPRNGRLDTSNTYLSPQKNIQDLNLPPRKVTSKISSRQSPRKTNNSIRPCLNEDVFEPRKAEKITATIALSQESHVDISSNDSISCKESSDVNKHSDLHRDQSGETASVSSKAMETDGSVVSEPGDATRIGSQTVVQEIQSLLNYGKERAGRSGSSDDFEVSLIRTLSDGNLIAKTQIAGEEVVHEDSVIADCKSDTQDIASENNAAEFKDERNDCSKEQVDSEIEHSKLRRSPRKMSSHNKPQENLNLQTQEENTDGTSGTSDNEVIINVSLHKESDGKNRDENNSDQNSSETANSSESEVKLNTRSRNKESNKKKTEIDQISLSVNDEVIKSNKVRQVGSLAESNINDGFNSDIPSDFLCYGPDGELLTFSKTLAERIKERGRRRGSVESYNINLIGQNIVRTRNNSFSSNVSNCVSGNERNKKKSVIKSPKHGKGPHTSALVASQKICNKYRNKRNGNCVQEKQGISSGYQGDDERGWTKSKTKNKSKKTKQIDSKRFWFYEVETERSSSSLDEEKLKSLPKELRTLQMDWNDVTSHSDDKSVRKLRRSAQNVFNLDSGSDDRVVPYRNEKDSSVECSVLKNDSMQEDCKEKQSTKGRVSKQLSSKSIRKEINKSLKYRTEMNKSQRQLAREVDKLKANVLSIRNKVQQRKRNTSPGIGRESLQPVRNKSRISYKAYFLQDPGSDSEELEDHSVEFIAGEDKKGDDNESNIEEIESESDQQNKNRKKWSRRTSQKQDMISEIVVEKESDSSIRENNDDKNTESEKFICRLQPATIVSNHENGKKFSTKESSKFWEYVVESVSEEDSEVDETIPKELRLLKCPWNSLKDGDMNKSSRRSRSSLSNSPANNPLRKTEHDCRPKSSLKTNNDKEISICTYVDKPTESDETENMKKNGSNQDAGKIKQNKGINKVVQECVPEISDTEVISGENKEIPFLEKEVPSNTIEIKQVENEQLCKKNKQRTRKRYWEYIPVISPDKNNQIDNDIDGNSCRELKGLRDSWSSFSMNISAKESSPRERRNCIMTFSAVQSPLTRGIQDNLSRKSVESVEYKNQKVIADLPLSEHIKAGNGEVEQMKCQRNSDLEKNVHVSSHEKAPRGNTCTDKETAMDVDVSCNQSDVKESKAEEEKADIKQGVDEKILSSPKGTFGNHVKKKIIPCVKGSPVIDTTLKSNKQDSTVTGINDNVHTVSECNKNVNVSGEKENQKPNTDLNGSKATKKATKKKPGWEWVKIPSPNKDIVVSNKKLSKETLSLRDSWNDLSNQLAIENSARMTRRKHFCAESKNVSQSSGKVMNVTAAVKNQSACNVDIDLSKSDSKVERKLNESVVEIAGDLGSEVSLDLSKKTYLNACSQTDGVESEVVNSPVKPCLPKSPVTPVVGICDKVDKNATSESHKVGALSESGCLVTDENLTVDVRSSSPVFKRSPVSKNPKASPFGKYPSYNNEKSVKGKRPRISNDIRESIRTLGEDGSSNKSNSATMNSPNKYGSPVRRKEVVVVSSPHSGYSTSPRERRRRSWKRKIVLESSLDSSNGESSPIIHQAKRRKLDKLKYVIDNEKVKSKSPKKLFQVEGTNISNKQTLQGISSQSKTHQNETVTKHDANNSFSLKWEPVSLNSGMCDETKKVKLNKSWTLISDRSASKLLSSEDDKESFKGFTEDDLEKGHLSDMSYEEHSEVDIHSSDHEWSVEDESNQDTEFSKLLPQFSSPGKPSDPDWELNVDNFMQTRVSEKNQSCLSVTSPWRSPRRSAKKLELCSPGKTKVKVTPVKSKRPSFLQRINQTETVPEGNGSDRETVDEDIEFNHRSPQKFRCDFSPLRAENGIILGHARKHATSTPSAGQSKNRKRLEKNFIGLVFSGNDEWNSGDSGTGIQSPDTNYKLLKKKADVKKSFSLKYDVSPKMKSKKQKT